MVCSPGGVTRSPLATLLAIVFSGLVRLGIVIPLLPPVAEHHTATPWRLGVLMALGALAVLLLVRPSWPWTGLAPPGKGRCQGTELRPRP